MARSGYEAAKLLSDYNNEILVTDMSKQDENQVKDLDERNVKIVITDDPVPLLDDSYDYEIVSGERRLRAAKLAGLSSIPSIILDVEQEISAEMSIIENIHSEPLNYFEHAVALQRLKEHYQDDFCDVSSRLGLSEHQMSKKLKLLELSYNERQILLNMNVSENNALGIAQITDKAQRHMLIESICGEGLNEDAIKSRLELIDRSNARSNCD
jgi:ParB family chromosome partitioning protein